ncbi:MAG TPA: isocitrate lyase/phosphoenolpyruvate mutase family protein [Candidatus Limnocylindrales bacterium]|nr:isocitrate lyase/phosphoenolpyruvate mutase family protein [Candidatus Limnocylindrales bacterium]
MGRSDRRERFHALHRDGLFVMPNAWDVGSARLLVSVGFQAIATTSSGHAASLGRADQQVTRNELLAHVEALAAAVDVPLSVDAERCFADDAAGVAETVELIAGAGAAGCSIEDYDPATDAIDAIDVATERVAAASEAARKHGMVLTARAENHLHEIDDLEDTIERLRAYRSAGADCVYAPGLVDPGQIERLVKAVDAPVNVLAMRGGPAVPDLAALGVRRVSTGGHLARVAYGALLAAARELQSTGTYGYLDSAVSTKDLEEALEVARPSD